MSNALSSPSSPLERVDTKFRTPVPELDDHRTRHLQVPQQKSPIIPTLEVSHATPRPSRLDEDALSQIDEALVQFEAAPSPLTRDFENAISDGDRSGEEFDYPPGSGRRNSTRPRRFGTNRMGTGIVIGRQDKFRDASSSRSTSPANSVEAFAEPRRRQRANTIDTRRSSIDEVYRARTYSNATGQRRPTLGHITIPEDLPQRSPTQRGLTQRGLTQRTLTQRTERDVADSVSFTTDDEPGKTYKIDYEELEEFVALCAQGKIPLQATTSQATSSDEPSPQVFHAGQPQGYDSEDLPNAILNGDNFFEKPVIAQVSHEADEKKVAALKIARESERPVERFTFFSSEQQASIKATKLGDFTKDGTSFRDLFEVGPDGGVWWLDVLNPTKAELEVIGKAFKIHRLTREDIETQEAREKVELFTQYYFVCFRSFNMDKKSEDFLDPIHVYIVVCTDGVLSFSYSPTPHAKNVRKRIAKLGDFVSLGPDYICYAMIDDIVDCFAPIIREAEQESENIEDQVFIAREDDLAALLRKIGDCRKGVLNLMRLLGGKADVIKGFAKRCNEQYEITPRGDIGLYLGDIQDHVVTMMSNLGHVEKMLSRSHANYLAQLSVDNILEGNSTNKALAKITVVATILVPLNLVTGLFGMNVAVPWKDYQSLAPFFGIVGVIALFVCCALLIARRLRAL